MKDIIRSSAAFASVIEELTTVSGWLWERGWAERNAGNMSMDVTEIMGELGSPAHGHLDSMQIATRGQGYASETAGRFFLVTLAGAKFRDIAKDPEKNTVVIQLSMDGREYRIVKGGFPPFRPTSELASHLLVHERLRKMGGNEKVVLHSHPTELIALSHIKKFLDESVLNNRLWGMMPEVKVQIPGGIGLIPYTLPGSQMLADATLKALERGRKAVLWAKHGCLATGVRILDAFDQIDIMNKAAKVLLMCLEAGEDPEGITQSQLHELALAFKLEGHST